MDESIAPKELIFIIVSHPTSGRTVRAEAVLRRPALSESWDTHNDLARVVSQHAWGGTRLSCAIIRFVEADIITPDLSESRWLLSGNRVLDSIGRAMESRAR
jgi:hypothetical protein